MKKTICVLLSLILMLAFVSCGDGAPADPKKAVVDAMKKTLSLDAVNGEIAIAADMAGVSLEIPVTIQFITEEDTLISAHMSTSVMGQAAEMTYVDGILYNDQNGRKEKKEATPADLSGTFDISGMSSSADQVDSMVESAEYVGKDDAGAMTFNVVMGSAFFGDSLSSLTDSLGADTANALSPENTACTMTVNKEGYLTSMTMDMDIPVTGTPAEMSAKANIVISFIDPGAPFEITAPADADDYLSDQKELVIAAYEKTAALTESDCSTMLLADMGELGYVEAPIDIKIVMEGDEIAAAAIANGSSATEVTYSDGILYMATQDYKVKAAITPDQYAIVHGEPTLVLDDEDLIEYALENGTDANGNVQYDVTMSDYFYNEIFANQMGVYPNADGITTTFSSKTCTMSVTEDGYLASIAASMSFTMDMSGESHNMAITLNAVYNDPGQSVEITAPADADAYEKYTAEELGF